VFGGDDQRASFACESSITAEPARDYPLKVSQHQLATSPFRWLARLTLAHEIAAYESLEQLPTDADSERAAFAERGAAALLQCSLCAGTEPFGAVYLESATARKWDFDITDFGLVANLLAAVMERRRVERELHFRARFERTLSHISNRLVNCA